jgi:hypothetical protein
MAFGFKSAQAYHTPIFLVDRMPEAGATVPQVGLFRINLNRAQQSE